jgi:SulP family sulfate permease
MMVMEKAGFIDRLGRENVCPHIDAALARAREILGLPPAAPTDPHHEEKQRLEAVRLELAHALDRVNGVLNATPIQSGSGKSDTSKIKVHAE